MSKRLMVPRYLMVLLLVVLLLVTACGASNGASSSPEIRLRESHNGLLIELKNGQTLVVSLEANPTTGHRWEAVGLDDQVLRSLGDPDFRPYSEQVGASGLQVMRFEAVGTGQATLNIVYHRPWQTDVQPLKTYTLHVRVR
jgi:inhibitor of cysteine peptidase